MRAAFIYIEQDGHRSQRITAKCADWIRDLFILCMYRTAATWTLDTQVTPNNLFAQPMCALKQLDWFIQKIICCEILHTLDSSGRDNVSSHTNLFQTWISVFYWIFIKTHFLLWYRLTWTKTKLSTSIKLKLEAQAQPLESLYYRNMFSIDDASHIITTSFDSIFGWLEQIIYIFWVLTITHMGDEVKRSRS